MIRPTPAAAALFAAVAPATLAIVLLDGGLWPFGLVLVGLAALLCAGDALLALPPARLGIAVDGPRLLYIGETGAITVDLAVPPRQRGIAVDLACDVGDLLETPPPTRVAVAGGGTARVTLPLFARRRGEAAVERLWLRWRGPLGLMRRGRIHAIDETIPVVPDTQAVRATALRFSAVDSPAGVKIQRQQGDGSEFEALRDYVTGLDPRSIDWKHSARHRALVCKEFQTERNHQIILAFDTGQLMSRPLAGVPRLDHAINAGLILGYMSLRMGDRVGVFGFDSAVRVDMQPVGGLHNFAWLQRASARLDYRPEETNFTLGLAELTGRLSRRSLVVLQTDFVDTVTAELMVENLGRLAARHLVVFVTQSDPDLDGLIAAPPRDVGDMAATAIADDFVRERLIVQERLRRLGIHCLEAPSGQVGADLLNRYLMIKQRELI